MKSLPLTREIHEKSMNLKVAQIHLNFRSVKNEGFLDVWIVSDHKNKGLYSLEMEIAKWGIDAYKYDASGDGGDFGDDLVYDLEKMTVFVSSWKMKKVDNDIDRWDIFPGVFQTHKDQDLTIEDDKHCGNP